MVWPSAVPVNELSTELGVVKHGATDRDISYGNIVAALALPLEVPEVGCKVMQTDNPSSGCGELGLAMMGPAIANAIASLTGKRIRHLPLTPEIVKRELSA